MYLYCAFLFSLDLVVFSLLKGPPLLARGGGNIRATRRSRFGYVFVSPLQRSNLLTVFCVIGLSLEELGLRALEFIPRERAINGIHAFNKLR